MLGRLLILYHNCHSENVLSNVEKWFLMAPEELPPMIHSHPDLPRACLAALLQQADSGAFHQRSDHGTKLKRRQASA